MGLDIQLRTPRLRQWFFNTTSRRKKVDDGFEDTHSVDLDSQPPTFTNNTGVAHLNLRRVSLSYRSFRLIASAAFSWRISEDSLEVRKSSGFRMMEVFGTAAVMELLPW